MAKKSWKDEYWQEPKKKVTIEDNQKKILLLLMHNPSMTFNKLWNKEGRSNKFAYHLKVLEKKGLVKGTTKGYKLTKKGQEHVAYLESKTGELWKFPVIAVITVIFDKKNDKILMLKRTQEPFVGYWGFHGGKLKSTQYILECAEDSIKNDTGLKCEVELKGLFSSKTIQDEELSYNHQLFIVKAVKKEGILLKKTKKGTNKWVKKEEVEKMKSLPNIPLLIKIATGKRFRWVEADRIKEGDKFKSIDVKKNLII